MGKQQYPPVCHFKPHRVESIYCHVESLLIIGGWTGEKGEGGVADCVPDVVSFQLV